jgi:hypothetical protein
MPEVFHYSDVRVGRSISATTIAVPLEAVAYAMDVFPLCLSGWGRQPVGIKD